MEDYKTNKRCIPTDSQVNDIGGRDQQNPQQDLLLALLSEMTNGHSPEIDITKNDGFITKDHIGFEFIMNDIRNISTKSRVIEVDKETVKRMIKYVHGGYKCIEPNIIK